MDKPKFSSLDNHLIEINRIIQQHGLSTNNHGLMHGTTGLSIYFYHLSRTVNNPEYEQLADDLLDKVFSSLSTSASPDFENGLAGIGWGIEYLVQNGFAEGNTDEILEEVDNTIFKTLQGDNLTSFELMNGLTGYLFYLVNRLKKTAYPKSVASHINSELLIMVINKLDVLIPNQFPSVIKEMNFDLLWQFPVMLYGLSEAFKLNIYPEKIKYMIKQWVPYFEVYIPSIHTNRIYLATILTLINELFTHEQLEKYIQVLLYATDFEILKTEFNPNFQNIRFGWVGVVWLLKRASLIIPENYPNYEKIESTRMEIIAKCKSNWDNIRTNSPHPNAKQFGLSEGLAGPRLMELLWPEVFNNVHCSKINCV